MTKIFILVLVWITATTFIVARTGETFNRQPETAVIDEIISMIRQKTSSPVKVMIVSIAPAVFLLLKLNVYYL